MLTSILLLLTLPSADVAPGTCVSDSRARQTALSPPTSGGEARLDLIRAEAVDEESEEEEFGGQGPPGDFPSSGTNPVRLTPSQPRSAHPTFVSSETDAGPRAALPDQ